MKEGAEAGGANMRGPHLRRDRGARWVFALKLLTCIAMENITNVICALNLV